MRKLGLIERRHPETWPCDDCGKNHADVYTMPNGDLLCERCELRERRAADRGQGAVCLTDAERDRVLWWLHRPVPPGPMKDLDVAIIRKLS